MLFICYADLKITGLIPVIIMAISPKNRLQFIYKGPSSPLQHMNNILHVYHLCMCLVEASAMLCVCDHVWECLWGTQLSWEVKPSPVAASFELTLVRISRRWCHNLSSGPDTHTKPNSVSTETCQTSKQSAAQLCMCGGRGCLGGNTWHCATQPGSSQQRSFWAGMAVCLQVYLAFSWIIGEDLRTGNLNAAWARQRFRDL